MIIQFSQQEIELIRSFFSKVDSGEAQKLLLEGYQEFPEWNTVFLLLRKLLAYGVYYVGQTEGEIRYEALQTKTQKPKDMLLNLHANLGQFENLLDTYIARQ